MTERCTQGTEDVTTTLHPDRLLDREENDSTFPRNKSNRRSALTEKWGQMRETVDKATGCLP